MGVDRSRHWHRRWNRQLTPWRGQRVLRVLLALTLALTSLVAQSVAVPPAAKADITTPCKWDFPWPRQVRYYIYTGGYQFTWGQSERVSYGPSTWSEGGFNLYFGRVYEGEEGEVYRGATSRPGAIAETRTTTLDCDRDAGRPIRWASTVFNQNYGFHEDCFAAYLDNGYNWCRDNGYYDLHNISAHEFGHWFWLNDDYGDTSATMFYAAGPGEWNKRDLAFTDRNGAYIMYGCRTGSDSCRW